jgi:hypothetical protein
MAIKVANRVANRGIVQLDQCQKAVFPIGCIEFPAPRADNSCAPVAIRRRRENAKEKGAGIPFISTRPGGGGAVRPYVSMGPKIVGLEILEVPPGGGRLLGLWACRKLYFGGSSPGQKNAPVSL